MTELEQLREKYEALGQQIERMEKAEKDPWADIAGYWYCNYHQGEVLFISVTRHLATCRSYGEAFLTKGEAEHHMKVREAQTRLANRIAEINAEEVWEFVEGHDYWLPMYCPQERMWTEFCWMASVFDEPDNRGCRRAIKTVCKEMPDALNLIYGVEK